MYDKIKLLTELSKLAWFLEKHALQDAKSADDKKSLEELTAIYRDIEKHIGQLQKSVCTISQ